MPADFLAFFKFFLIDYLFVKFKKKGFAEMEQYDGEYSLFDLLKTMQDISVENISHQFQEMDRLIDTLGSIANVLTSFLAPEYTSTFCLLQDVIEQSVKFLTAYEYHPKKYVEVSNETMNSFHEIASIVPKDKQEEYKEAIKPTEEKGKRVLSAKNLLWLISFVVPMILSIMLSNATSEQLTEISKNQEKEMEMIEERLDLDRQEVEILKNIQNLLQQINDSPVPDDLIGTTLHEEIDARSDILDGQEHNGAENDENENSDAQD